MAQTDPATFTVIREQPRRGGAITIASTNAEVDDQSTVQIIFDVTRMAPPAPLVPGGPARPQVQIRVEAYSTKGSSRTPIAPIPHYVDLNPGAASTTADPAAPAASETISSGTVVYHDKFFNTAIGAGVIPNTEITLRGSQAEAADSVELRITNLVTQQSLIVTLTPQKFGFRTKVSDSLMFVKRLGISTSDRANGVEDFNFGPSPGVTYGGTYLPRGNNFVRFLQPGLGINVLFTKWGEPAFDISTGQFLAGTQASDIQTGLGGQFSLFGNVLQFTYGANLQVDHKRSYFGIGVSFVNLTSKISGLISK